MDPKSHAVLDGLQAKIRGIIEEFAAGELSSEQFNILYERYNTQIEIARGLLEGDAGDPLDTSGFSTFEIKQATRGLAQSLAVFHVESGRIIDSVGEFDLSPTQMSLVLNEIDAQRQAGAQLKPRVENPGPSEYVVYISGAHATTIVQFKNEPARKQIEKLERIHHDFERANVHLLEKSDVDPATLAKTFVSFVSE